MWQEYEKETQPYRSVKILETIANTQINVSSYYESTTVALEVSGRFNNGNGRSVSDQTVMSFEDWKNENIRPRIGNDSDYSQEENGQYYWNLHKKYNEYVEDWNHQIHLCRVDCYQPIFSTK